MPHVKKKYLAHFVRTECQRQLRLNLTSDAAQRAAQGMPDPVDPRPGLEDLAREGYRWQAQKVDDLQQVFGAAAVRIGGMTTRKGVTVYEAQPLAGLLASAKPGQFLVEAKFDMGPAFQAALGIQALSQAPTHLTYGEMIPDLIEVLPPAAAGGAPVATSAATPKEVTPRGDLVALAPTDVRLRLRVIDIKMTAEASPSHFIEVAYYSMALAGWLVDHGLAGIFCVAAEGAVWPGTHDASALRQAEESAKAQGRTATAAEIAQAFTDDLEFLPFEVFAPRVRRFFAEDLPETLAKQPWTELPWHVDSRCKGCEYLGDLWKTSRTPIAPGGAVHPHCWDMAQQQEHLSRVAFVSRGSGAALSDAQVGTVTALSGCQAQHAAFDGHHVLRASRSVLGPRAKVLTHGVSGVIADAGTSAVMPRWTDVHIYVSVDFDVGSGITLAFGIEGAWVGPNIDPATGKRQFKRMGPSVLVNPSRAVRTERDQLDGLLDAIERFRKDVHKAAPDATVQFYLWDEVQYTHLTRVIGRHLPHVVSKSFKKLAWLFPPETVLPNPALMTRDSPITIVRDVMRATLAVPVPHYYNLPDVALAYHPARIASPEKAFWVNPFFSDPLSDQVPSERAHEIWGKAQPPHDWVTQSGRLKKTVDTRLRALAAVIERLEKDLGSTLEADAPRWRDLGVPTRKQALAPDSQLWYAFARLNKALDTLEIMNLRAMPPHEREARFKSAELVQRVDGPQRNAVLTSINVTNPAVQSEYLVYELSDRSLEVRFKDGDFGLALAPKAQPGFLERRVWQLRKQYPTLPQIKESNVKAEALTAVSVERIDRERKIVILRYEPRYGITLQHLELAGIDFRQHVMLDPIPQDFFVDKKLLPTLEAIGRPASAGRANPLVLSALGQSPLPLTDLESPAAEVLWRSDQIWTKQVPRNLAAVRGDVQAECSAHGGDLNISQWRAWETALTNRVSLVWGPPGTGKSKTARAIVLGAVLDAHQRGEPLRVLVCAATYGAMDNVLLGAERMIRNRLGPAVKVRRVHAPSQAPHPNAPPGMDVKCDTWQPSQELLDLRDDLAMRQGIVVVGTTEQQAHKLRTIDPEVSPQVGLFDLILIDESSQMDVAHATLALATLAPGGAVVCAGDPLQLPPIHAAQPPDRLEDYVGPIYSYLDRVHRVVPEMLETNYRSNRTIVGFTREAGYHPQLTSGVPDVVIRLLTPLPTQLPSDWPATMPWAPEWNDLLDPAQPAVTFIYKDGRSSQWNDFEADAVTALCWLLAPRLADRLDHDPTGASSSTAYAPEGFWSKGIGVVTPHRAQQGLIVGKLQSAFSASGVDPRLIRDAVDTVERFQGQERDVIIASFALGDADAIGSEEEFLMNLNRFNVMASRPRAKLIVLCSREVVDYLPSTTEVMQHSRLLKVFADSFCRASAPLVLPKRLPHGAITTVDGLKRWAL